MAAGAVMYNFAVQLADVDRGVYEEVPLRAARHPSETEGISSTDEPAVLVRDLTGRLTTWIEALPTRNGCTMGASWPTARWRILTGPVVVGSLVH